MKPLRSLLKNGALALLCFSTFSCVDNTYNLSDLSSKAELFKNSLSTPVGTITIRLDSVIGGMDVDTSILTVKNGMYVFGYTGDFNVGDISSQFNNFKLTGISDVSSTINLFDASGYPPTQPAFALPATEAQTYHGSTIINLPTGFGSTNLIKIDSISLKNTRLNITTQCVGLAGGNGKTLGDNVSITFTAVGKAADYFVNGIKKTSWTMKLGETSNVEIRKIRLTDGINQLTLNRDIRVTIANAGDIMVTNMIKTYVNVNMKFVNGIDYDLVWGKVTYALPRKEITPIKFEGLGKIINENDLLSIYDPKIILNTVGNIGVPVDVNLYMTTSNTKTGQTSPGLTNGVFHIPASTDTLTFKTYSDTINRSNGTAELFKINPDIIRLGYDAQAVTLPNKNHFIAKNSQLSLSYKMEIPLQFGNDLKISVDTTLENPFKDNLDILDDQKDMTIALTLNVKNKIPLNMQIQLDALDKNNLSLFKVKTDTIQAANTNPTTGLSTTYKETNTDITLTPTQIDKLKDTKMFQVSFIITGKKNEAFVTVQPSDYITLKIGGKINGGVLIDFSSKSK